MAIKEEAGTVNASGGSRIVANIGICYWSGSNITRNSAPHWKQKSREKGAENS